MQQFPVEIFLKAVFELIVSWVRFYYLSKSSEKKTQLEIKKLRKYFARLFSIHLSSNFLSSAKFDRGIKNKICNKILWKLITGLRNHTLNLHYLWKNMVIVTYFSICLKLSQCILPLQLMDKEGAGITANWRDFVAKMKIFGERSQKAVHSREENEGNIARGKASWLH